MVIFQKLILNIQINYIIYTITIHLLQKNLKLLMICCQIIAKKIVDKYNIKVDGVKE